MKNLKFSGIFFSNHRILLGLRKLKKKYEISYENMKYLIQFFPIYLRKCKTLETNLNSSVLFFCMKKY